MDSEVRAALSERFNKHLTKKQSVDTLLDLVQGTDRLFRWIASRPVTKPWTERIAQLAPWFSPAFRLLEEVGSRPATQEDRLEAVSRVTEEVRRSDVDRAIVQAVTRYASDLMNGNAAGILDGQVMIERGKATKADHPFDFIVLNDNPDTFDVSFVILGQADDSPERIQQEIDRRLAGKSTKESLRPWIQAVLSDHYSYVADRISLQLAYVGGPQGERDENNRLPRIRSFKIVPLENFLGRLALPSLDFQDYLNHGAAPDMYGIGTRIEGDEVLNNARFSRERRCLSLPEWQTALTLMTPHHRLFKQNPEIVTAFQLLSPLEVNIKLP